PPGLQLDRPFNRVAGFAEVLQGVAFAAYSGAKQFLDRVLPRRTGDTKGVQHCVNINLAALGLDWAEVLRARVVTHSPSPPQNPYPSPAPAATRPSGRSPCGRPLLEGTVQFAQRARWRWSAARRCRRFACGG